jgi:hypothetical protein
MVTIDGRYVATLFTLIVIVVLPVKAELPQDYNTAQTAIHSKKIDGKRKLSPNNSLTGSPNTFKDLEWLELPIGSDVERKSLPEGWNPQLAPSLPGSPLPESYLHFVSEDGESEAR